MKTKLILASAVAALALTTPAFANDSHEDVKEKFSEADANKDGTLSQAEWSAEWPDKADKFAAADANKDGKVTLSEKQALHDKMKDDKHS